MDSEDEGAPGLPGLPGGMGGMAAMAGGLPGGMGGMAAMAGGLPGGMGGMAAMAGGAPLGALAGAAGIPGAGAIAAAAPLPPPAVDAPEAKGGEIVPADGGGGGDEEEAADDGTDALMCDFFIKEKAKKARAIFVPEDCRLNAAKLKQLFEETWELDPKFDGPSTLISADAGTVHPVQFASQKLVELPQFGVTYTDAKKHTERVIKDAPEDEKKTMALGIVNDVLFLKLKTVFASVLDAAQIAKNWIVIDRINAKSPAAELLFEAAMSMTSATPKVVVIDSMCRL